MRQDLSHGQGNTRGKAEAFQDEGQRTTGVSFQAPRSAVQRLSLCFAGCSRLPWSALRWARGCEWQFVRSGKTRRAYEIFSGSVGPELDSRGRIQQKRRQNSEAATRSQETRD